MSQAGLPTPAPSSEIQAKPVNLVGLDSNFALPPAAISPPTTRKSSIIEVPSSAFNSPEQSTKSKSSSGSKRKSSSADQQEYALPPPPTRSRKIIQMKPRQDALDTSPPSARKSQPTLAPAPTLPVQKSTPSSSASSSSASASATTGTKRKASASNTASSASNAATRKMARKTAHSLIERRRRSKMNEEFGVLKDMIPACSGQEMHKLAILQASIEYMRYLESCLSDLKSAHAQCPRVDSRYSSTSSASPDHTKERERELPPIRSVVESMPPASVFTPISPAGPLGMRSTTTSPYHGAQSYQLPLPTGSGLPSPALNAQFSPAIHAQPSPALNAQPSPRISPRHMPEDHEVTAALLMLNAERRSWGDRPRGSASSGRGFSVKDLLAE